MATNIWDMNKEIEAAKVANGDVSSNPVSPAVMTKGLDGKMYGSPAAAAAANKIYLANNKTITPVETPVKNTVTTTPVTNTTASQAFPTQSNPNDPSQWNTLLDMKALPGDKLDGEVTEGLPPFQSIDPGYLPIGAGAPTPTPQQGYENRAIESNADVISFGNKIIEAGETVYNKLDAQNKQLLVEQENNTQDKYDSLQTGYNEIIARNDALKAELLSNAKKANDLIQAISGRDKSEKAASILNTLRSRGIDLSNPMAVLGLAAKIENDYKNNVAKAEAEYLTNQNNITSSTETNRMELMKEKTDTLSKEFDEETAATREFTDRQKNIDVDRYNNSQLVNKNQMDLAQAQRDKFIELGMNAEAAWDTQPEEQRYASLFSFFSSLGREDIMTNELFNRIAIASRSAPSFSVAMQEILKGVYIQPKGEATPTNPNTAPPVNNAPPMVPNTPPSGTGTQTTTGPSDYTVSGPNAQGDYTISYGDTTINGLTAAQLDTIGKSLAASGKINSWNGTASPQSPATKTNVTVPVITKEGDNSYTFDAGINGAVTGLKDLAAVKTIADQFLANGKISSYTLPGAGTVSSTTTPPLSTNIPTSNKVGSITLVNGKYVLDYGGATNIELTDLEQLKGVADALVKKGSIGSYTLPTGSTNTTQPPAASQPAAPKPKQVEIRNVGGNDYAVFVDGVQSGGKYGGGNTSVVRPMPPQVLDAAIKAGMTQLPPNVVMGTNPNAEVYGISGPDYAKNYTIYYGDKMVTGLQAAQADTLGQSLAKSGKIKFWVNLGGTAATPSPPASSGGGSSTVTPTTTPPKTTTPAPTTTPPKTTTPAPTPAPTAGQGSYTGPKNGVYTIKYANGNTLNTSSKTVVNDLITKGIIAGAKV